LQELCPAQSLVVETQELVSSNPSTDAFILLVSVEDVTSIKAVDMNGIEVYSHGRLKVIDIYFEKCFKGI